MIGGRRVNEAPPRDRNLAMVFQNYALYPHLTVFENIAFPLRVRGDVSGAEIGEASRGSGSDAGAHRAPASAGPAQLSGGQRQRVAMGRAIVRHADAFLFDEPLSNLDAKLRGQMRLELLRLQRRLGTTTVYVTHDQTEAMTLGDRVALLRRGVLQQVAPPRTLYDEPANLFVAGFIGSPPMNLVAATVEDGRLQLPSSRSSCRRTAGLGRRTTAADRGTSGGGVRGSRAGSRVGRFRGRHVPRTSGCGRVARERAVRVRSVRCAIRRRRSCGAGARAGHRAAALPARGVGRSTPADRTWRRPAAPGRSTTHAPLRPGVRSRPRASEERRGLTPAS